MAEATKRQPKNALTIYERVNRKSMSVLSTAQILHIMQKTPDKHIYQRKGKGGQTWDYVTGAYIKKVLNYTFGWNWDFEVKEKGREGDLVWVLGRLTIRIKRGKTEQSIVKEQFGRAEVKFLKETKDPVDYGNDLKAASTDALKKCASELGIASDVYAKEEFKEIEMIKVEETKEFPKMADGNEPATEAQLQTLKSLVPEFEPEKSTLTKQMAADKIRELVTKRTTSSKNGETDPKASAREKEEEINLDEVDKGIKEMEVKK